jgi:hypothetical protein
VIDEEFIAAQGLNGASDSMTVFLAEEEGAEDQEIEGSLD